MATPVADSYSTVSGGVIAAGRRRYPIWRTGQSVNEWREIAGSAMVNFPPSINPGRAAGVLASKMDAWNGLAIDTRSSTVWSLANGGHDDYHGNEVCKFNLASDSPTWIEVLPSNSAAQFTVPNNAGYYSSGRPASVHSYYSQQFIESRNRAVRFGAMAASSSGNGFRNIDGFNCAAQVGTNGWDAPGTYPDMPAGMSTGQPVCKNPTTEDVYTFNGNISVWKWTQSSNSWSQINSGYPPVDPIEGATAYDTSRNRIFLLRDSTVHHTFDPTSGTFTSQTLSGTAATTLGAASKSAGMIYEPTLDAYLVRLGRSSGGAVYSINASTFAVTAISTTGGASVPATVNISGSPENVYSKWLYAPLLGGVVFFPAYAQNAWFLRTH